MTLRFAIYQGSFIFGDNIGIFTHIIQVFDISITPPNCLVKRVYFDQNPCSKVSQYIFGLQTGNTLLYLALSVHHSKYFSSFLTDSDQVNLLG